VLSDGPREKIFSGKVEFINSGIVFAKGTFSRRPAFQTWLRGIATFRPSRLKDWLEPAPVSAGAPVGWRLFLRLALCDGTRAVAVRSRRCRLLPESAVHRLVHPQQKGPRVNPSARRRTQATLQTSGRPNNRERQNLRCRSSSCRFGSRLSHKRASHI
jgi:hypothetical protein